MGGGDARSDFVLDTVLLLVLFLLLLLLVLVYTVLAVAAAGTAATAAAAVATKALAISYPGYLLVNTLPRETRHHPPRVFLAAIDCRYLCVAAFVFAGRSIVCL